MICPKCGKNTRVVESRKHEYGTRRRRKCSSCINKFSTIEVEASFKKAHLPVITDEFDDAVGRLLTSEKWKKALREAFAAA